MDIRVLSADFIYVEGRKIRGRRLFFDKYFNHTRDIFVHKNVVIKLDRMVSRDEYVDGQCDVEVGIYKKLRKSEKRFFAGIITHGRFKNEEGYKGGWIAQPLIYKSKKKENPYDHKDWSLFSKICDDNNISDVFDSERNCFVDVLGRLICVDWGV